MLKEEDLDWNDIKVRYLKGQKPREIAEIYNVRAGLVSERLSREGWRKEKDKTAKKTIDTKLKRHFAQMEKIEALIDKMLEQLLNDSSSAGAYILNGEGLPNKFHQELWKQLLSTRAKEIEKALEGNQVENEEPPGFVVKAPDA